MAVRNKTIEYAFALSTASVASATARDLVARDDATVTQTIANSGENQSFLFSRDVTSYFVTNYTGTSMTADCRLTVSGVITSNATAKLIITYEYDDVDTK